MKTILLKIRDKTFDETEKILATIPQSRNDYINEAIEFYNKFQKRKMLEEQLKMESKLLAENSMEVLQDFETFEDKVGPSEF